MEHFFELPVTYNKEALSLKGRLVTFGYVYKFHIIANGRELVFEKDDEQNYRVLTTDGDVNNKSFDKELIEAIIESLKTIGN